MVDGNDHYCFYYFQRSSSVPLIEDLCKLDSNFRFYIRIFYSVLSEHKMRYGKNLIDLLNLPTLVPQRE